MQTCPACTQGLQANGSLARETAPVWGTLLLIAVVIIPAVGWVLYKEKQAGRW